MTDKEPTKEYLKTEIILNTWSTNEKLKGNAK